MTRHEHYVRDIRQIADLLQAGLITNDEARRLEKSAWARSQENGVDALLRVMLEVEAKVESISECEVTYHNG